MPKLRLGSSMQWLRILREVNLRRIRAAAEQPFRLVVTGDEDMARRLAQRLDARSDLAPGQPRTMFVAAAADARDDGDLTMTVVALRPGEASSATKAAIAKMRKRGKPFVIADVGDGSSAGRASVGEGDVPRIALPSTLSDAELVERLGTALIDAAADEDLRVAMGRALPSLRPMVIDRLVEDTARANAIYAGTTGIAGWVPIIGWSLAAADMVVLTKNQVIMAYRIALISGKKGRATEVIGEMLSVLGGGLFFRQVARTLVGIVPVVGLLPKVAVAYAGTRIIGAQVRRWAMEGGIIGANELRELATEALDAGREVAGNLRRDDSAGREASSDHQPALAAQGEPIPMPDGDGKDVFAS